MASSGPNVVAGSTSGNLDPTAVADAVKIVHDHAERIFVWNYDRDRDRLVTLYNRAMASQWNSVTELDWSTPVDPEGLVDADGPFLRLVREAVKTPGSPIASWGEREIRQLGVETFKANLS